MCIRDRHITWHNEAEHPHSGIYNLLIRREDMIERAAGEEQECYKNERSSERHKKTDKMCIRDREDINITLPCRIIEGTSIKKIE